MMRYDVIGLFKKNKSYISLRHDIGIAWSQSENQR